MMGFPGGGGVQVTVSPEVADILEGIFTKQKSMDQEEAELFSAKVMAMPHLYRLSGGEGRKIQRPVQVSMSSSAFPAHTRGH